MIFWLLLLVPIDHLSSFILDGQKLPFRDTSLSWEQRVDDLVNRLTLQEHTEQLAIGGGTTPDIKRLGIGHYEWWSNCERGDTGNDATSFPIGINLAAAWDKDLLFRVARASATELRAFNNHWISQGKYGIHKGLSCLSPTVDLYRDPRWGRNPQTWGEDPYFQTVYVDSFLKGLHGDDSRFILANGACKHFTAASGPDSYPVSRFNFDAKISERDLQTSFLPPYKACVDSGVYGIFCSHNKINGVPACANKYILRDILRRDWGYKGYVISECGAMQRLVHNSHYYKNYEEVSAGGLQAGTNLNCQGWNDNAYLSIADAVKSGKISESLVKDMAKPLWYTRMRLGEFDPPNMVKYKSYGMDLVQSQAHRDIALEAALKSFVLLKNDNNFLPLDKNHQYNTIAVVGPIADSIHDQNGGYSPNVMPKYASSIKDGLDGIAKTTNSVSGCKDGNNCKQYDSQSIINAVQNAEVVFVCLGLGRMEQEGSDRRDLNLPGHQADLLKDAIAHSPKNTKIVLMMINAGPFDIEEFDRNDKVASIIELFYPAQSTGTAVRRLITHQNPGDVFSGKLPMTWMSKLSQVPPMTDYSMKERTYRYITYTPLYPFGYGLSYTSFKYSNLKIDRSIKAGWHVKGTFDVENTGDYDADEVSQVYVQFVNSSEPAPQIQLASFHRTHIAKHSKKTVKFIVHGQSISLWNDKKGWIVNPGTVNLYVGGQQPNQQRKASSNTLQSTFKIEGHHTFGRGKSAKWYPTTQ